MLTTFARELLVDLALALALLMIILLALSGIGLPLTAQTTFDQEIGLHSSLKVGQSFVAEADSLYRLDLLLARRGPNSQPVVLHLQAAPAPASDEVTVEINASLLEDLSSPIRRPHVYRPFTFSPLSGSAGKKFLFYVESPLSTAENPVLVEYQSQDAYPEGEGYTNSAALSGDLAFKAYYAGAGPVPTAALLLTRLTEQRPFPLSENAFYVIAACTCLTLVVRLVRTLCSPLLN